MKPFISQARPGPFARCAARPSLLLLLLLCTSLLLSLACPQFGIASIVQHAAAATPPPPPSPITETELIAIDVGHENMKISAWRVQEEDLYIKPGGTGTVTTTTTSMSGSVTMVLNDQTNRKSPPCVAFRYFKAPAASMQKDGAATNATSVGEKEEEGGLLYPPGYQLERTFAEQAQALALRFPTQVVCSPAQLLGYTLRNTSTEAAVSSPHQLTEGQLAAAYSFHVKALRQPQEAPPQRDALGVFVPFFTNSTTESATDGSMFSAEELTAMLLGYARRMAEKADAGDNALSEDDTRHLLELLNSTGGEGDLPLRGHAVPRYAALTVPVHTTVAQRQALMDAAALAGLRVVRLVHSTTGAAVQLAYTKAEQVFVADKTQYVMVYDMGSQQAEVAIYAFAAVPATIAKRVQYEGSVELKALVGSRTLGGSAFDECIAAQWDGLYFGGQVLSGVGQAATEAERRLAAKQRGSLLRAAHKAKETLSVNQEAHVTLDGLHADAARFTSAAQQHVRQRTASVTADGLLSLRYARQDFEQECRALFDAAVALRDDAVAATNGLVANVGALARFEVIGGGTRVPLLLQRLSEGYRGDRALVDRTLNSDEAAVLGTTLLTVATAPRALQLRGAQTVPHFRVREWLTNAVYASVESSSAGDVPDKARLQLLFPAFSDAVPATRSVRVKLSDDTAARDGVALTLYSGPEVDALYRAHAEGAVASVPVPAGTCAGCFARTCVAEGIAEAASTVVAQLQRQYVGGSIVRESAEVVVEAVATESGIPHCNVAYLHAVYRVTPAATTTTIAAAGVAGEDKVKGEGERKEEPTHEVPTEAPGEDAEDADGEETNQQQQQQQQQQPDAAVPADPQPASSAVTVEKVIALPLRRSSTTTTATNSGGVPALVRGYNMEGVELSRSHRRVRRLLAIDDVRLHRSTLRNDIESVTLWVKEQAVWDAEDAVAVPGLDPAWRDTVRQVGEWLDDFGETADVPTLEERLAVVRAIKQALRALQSG